MLKYSIIIPHYNSTKYLEKLINSIPVKKDMEIIIVDDKSSNLEIENLKNILKKYKMKNIELFFNSTNIKSAGTCRNIGLKKAKGEWILFADSDDFFIDNFLDIIENSIKKIDEEVDVIYYSPISIDTITNKESFRGIKLTGLIKKYLHDKSYENEIRLRYCSYAPWSKIIRKELIISNNIFFDEIIVSNDLIFSFKIGKQARKIYAEDKNIYCVTKNPTSLMTIKDFNKFKIRIEKFIEYYYLMSERERKIIEISPIPLLIRWKNVNLKELIKAIIILKNNKIKFFKYLKINKERIKLLYNIILK